MFQSCLICTDFTDGLQRLSYTQEELALRCKHLWRSLLIPYDDSAEAHYLLERIKQKVRSQQDNAPQQLILCWVVEGSGRSTEVAESQYQQAIEKLELLGQELRQLGFMVEIAVRKGNPVQEVLSVAAEYNISSIAL